MKAIRAFFDALDYLEVDTPLLSVSTNSDIHIQSIQASVCRQRQYLQTSPEFAMKRLLAAGSGSIYQICHAFRDEEQGRIHHPEFTLLEWYSLGFDYRALMSQIERLVMALFQRPVAFQRVSYFDCFQNVLGIDLSTDSLHPLRLSVSEHIPGIDAQSLSRDDCMDLLISQVIARQFSGFTFVYDYPASQASLARIRADNPLLAERFELFYNDMELANGFSELTDASQQHRRFQQDARIRAERGLPVYPLDGDFLQALERGLPDCAGVAIGLERLMMVMLEVDSINQLCALDGN